MNAEEALEFLRDHQPMPSDWDIADREGEMFVAILDYFEKHPDPRCLPLFIGSVSKGTTLGMYEHIKFVLMAHDKNEILPHLRKGLLQGNDGTKERCCWWATDVDAWELEEQIRPLADHPDEDIRIAAQTFLELKAELGK